MPDTQYSINVLLFSRAVVADSLRPHELQHARLLCPSLSPGVCSNSCPLSRWCHPTISSFVTLFSSWLQSFPASRSFPMTRLFTSGGQSIGASALASVLPMNIQGWFPLWSTYLISLLSEGLWRVFSSTTIQKHQFFSAQPFSILTSTLDYRKNHTFDCITEQAHFLTVFACGSAWNIIAIQFLFANWKTPWPLGKMGWRCLNEAIVSQKERWGFLYTCTILCVECPTLCKKIEISHLFKKMKWNFSG